MPPSWVSLQDTQLKLLFLMLKYHTLMWTFFNADAELVDGQTKLIEAAENSGSIKRFFPSEWGGGERCRWFTICSIRLTYKLDISMQICSL